MKRQKRLLEWIAIQHAGQLIRRTLSPYASHLKAVAERASLIPLGYEIGLCHDLFEKTNVTEKTLQTALLLFEYNSDEIQLITRAVTELSNEFTRIAYPLLEKADRKKREAARFATISSPAQTVKYADLMYNINWMQKHDQPHLRKYLKRKKQLVKSMQGGNAVLRDQLLQLINSCLGHEK
ncbi:hypothetical protein FO440_23005 [Mucilaginibacter corticis]|uniref:Metal-dependent phosphohydrolase n=1 Tax=Mucilaginibacter corticis TaxID=2597670 RepID=A0A556M957_9SPHI|nr:hypothetical protein [Mucilaginibacter corticis]TSJ36376.1 hypothetical protein FO440_23005 [Mucilaginibacter corticis]